MSTKKKSQQSTKRSRVAVVVDRPIQDLVVQGNLVPAGYASRRPDPDCKATLQAGAETEVRRPAILPEVDRVHLSLRDRNRESVAALDSD